jgi:transcriptional regulator with XRE-family HTH domain
MSPRKFAAPASDSVVAADRRLWFGVGRQLRDARLAKKLSVAELARLATVSRDVVYLVEAGERASTEAVVRLAAALGLSVEFTVSNPRRKDARPSLRGDPVHSVMGEFEVAHFRALSFPTGLDEPYQYYQFAGRADVGAWDLEAQALLHIENRTRFPDFQEMAGAFNSKRAYLGTALAQRLGVRRWRSETHVIAALWSAEVIHALRQRPESFRSICPDAAEAFGAWWSGVPPRTGSAAILVLLDPLAAGRQRPWLDLDEALARARPRYAGYAEAARAVVTTRADAPRAWS